jgi:molybdate transport system substrate-binding protein
MGVLKKIGFLLFFCVFLSAEPLFIGCAANVSYAMPEVVKEFNKKYHDIKVEVIYSSSGKLTAQIMQNAPYEIFFSANMKYPNYLYKKGFAKTAPKVYAMGSLALFSRQRKNFNHIKSILIKSSSIAIANPKTAPYGEAAVEFLKNIGIFEKVKNKLVFAQTVTGAVLYVLKAVEIGFVSKSSLCGKRLKYFKEKENWVEIDKNRYTPIKQAVVLLKNSSLNAEKFYKFVFSKNAKKIFRKYGYIVE